MPIFPEEFLWGTASSAYQIEGSTDKDGRGRGIWDTFLSDPTRVVRGDTALIACDQYSAHLEEDLDLIADLGVRSYRFSISWPRIQPDGRGKVNRPGLEFYRRLVDGLHERHIAPMLTLYHWDLPQSLQDVGGWPERDTASRFADFAALVAAELRDYVPYWVTLNEPWISSWLGHSLGMHAPGWTDDASAFAAMHHQLLGHGLAVQAIRAASTTGHVGISLFLSPTQAATESPADAAAAHRADGNQNRLQLDPLLAGTYPEDMLELYREVRPDALIRDGDLETIGSPLDFLGVNYYTRHHISADAAPPRPALQVFGPRLQAKPVLPVGMPVGGLGFVDDPAGLTDLLTRLNRDYQVPPIYITENGAAVDDYVDPSGHCNDIERVEYLRDHLKAVRAALEAGVDVRGYFVWSPTDNFEWSFGYAKRFGLVYVDFGTQRRTPKRSYSWYREVIEERGASLDAAVPIRLPAPSPSAARQSAGRVA
jgi:beta-glucosidase